MKYVRYLCLAAAMAIGAINSAGAVTIFTANLTEAQEVAPPAPLGASGSALLRLNDAMTRLEMTVQLFGLDLDGNQTASVDDDVVAMHIHAAPAGVNGGVVFGLISPNSDLNGDLTIDPVAGLIFSAWDVGEGNGTDLPLQLGNLFNQGLYFNVHTTASPAGQVRGQIVSEPAALGLLAGGLAVAGFMRRRGHQASN